MGLKPLPRIHAAIVVWICVLIILGSLLDLLAQRCTVAERPIDQKRFAVCVVRVP